MTGRKEYFPSRAPATVSEDRATGACAGMVDDHLWFPHADEEAEALAEAKVICAPCPIRDACLTHAIEFKEPGIWAATTETQRQRQGVGKCHKAGHDLTLPNATVPGRGCRVCANARERARMARKRAEVAS